LEWQVEQTGKPNASGLVTTIVSGFVKPDMEGVEVVLLLKIGADVLCYIDFVNHAALNESAVTIETLWPLPGSAVPSTFLLELKHRTSSCDKALSLSFEVDSTVVLTEHSHDVRVCNAGVSSRRIHWNEPGSHVLSIGFVSNKTGRRWGLVDPLRFFTFVPASAVSESAPASRETAPARREVARASAQRNTVQETLDCWLSTLDGRWTWLQPSAEPGRPYGWLYAPGAAMTSSDRRNNNCGLRLPLAWQPSSRCPLAEGAWPLTFEAPRAKEVLSHYGLLAFLGDSMTEQHHESFMSAFPGSSYDEVRLDLVDHVHWKAHLIDKTYPRRHMANPPKEIHRVENQDHVHALNGSVVLGSSGVARTLPVWFLGYELNGTEKIIEMLESGMLESSEAESRALPTVLVMNRGAHYASDDIVLAQLNSTLRLLRSRFPESPIIWRATIPGTHLCERYFEPFSSMDLLPPREMWPTLGWPWNWGLFDRQNALVRQLIEKIPGAYYLDVVNASMLRPESHVDSAGLGGDFDCLHYCLPGPPDLWTVALLELLALLASEKGSGRHGDDSGGRVADLPQARGTGQLDIKARHL
jgi:hypothetical protein